MAPISSTVRSALVTGGGTGIGLATALVLNRAGWDVTIVGRRADVLARAADMIAEHGEGSAVTPLVADLGDPEAATGIVGTHVGRTGGIDAVVAGAGSYAPAPLTSLTAGQWDATLDVHVRSVVLTAAAAAQHMTAAGHGRIVLISSVNAMHSEPETIDYSAAKAAIVSVARSLAVDLGGTGVTANAVAPGWVTTAMTQEFLDASSPERMRRVNALGRPGNVEEIAAVIAFLVLDAPEFLTGATIAVDGGQTALAPLP